MFYDFNKPEDIPKELHKQFHLCVIDPPFITREVWEKYAEAAKLLLEDGGHILGSTIDENESMMKEGKKHTKNVVTRNYRAPEVFFGDLSYDG